MFGAIVGDILGSAYEGGQADSRDVALFGMGSTFTDDTVCTLAIAEAVLTGNGYAEMLRKWGTRYPTAGYGGTFRGWLFKPEAGPYQSFANGALMRVSPAIVLSRSLEEAQENARAATAVTHDHAVAFAAVEAYTEALWAALQGATRDDVCQRIMARGYAPHDIEIQHLQGKFCLRADETLEDVLTCLRRANDFESLMRECLYHGGDTDTICAIAGPLGEILWGIPEGLLAKAMDYVSQDMVDVLSQQYTRMAQLHPTFWGP